MSFGTRNFLKQMPIIVVNTESNIGQDEMAYGLKPENIYIDFDWTGLES